MLIAAFLGAMLTVLSPIALFVIDAIWIRHFAEPRIQVLQVDLKEEQEKQQEKAQW